MTKPVEPFFSEKTQSWVSLSLVQSASLPIPLTPPLPAREGGLGELPWAFLLEEVECHLWVQMLHRTWVEGPCLEGTALIGVE